MPEKDHFYWHWQFRRQHVIVIRNWSRKTDIVKRKWFVSSEKSFRTDLKKWPICGGTKEENITMISIAKSHIWYLLLFCFRICVPIVVVIPINIFRLPGFLEQKRIMGITRNSSGLSMFRIFNGMNTRVRVTKLYVLTGWYRSMTIINRELHLHGQRLNLVFSYLSH